MQSLYLNANLNGLIEELRKYTNKENIIQFIKDMDFISKYKDDINNKFTFFYKNYLINSYKNMNMFLIKCYTKKLLLETNLSNSEMRQNIMSFIGLFPASIIIKNENKCDKYKIIDDIEFYKYIVKIEKLIEQYRIEENIK